MHFWGVWVGNCVWNLKDTLWNLTHHFEPMVSAKYTFYEVLNVWRIMICFSYDILSLSETDPWSDYVNSCFTPTDTLATLTGLQPVGFFAIAHYNDVIMGTIASQITSPTIVYSTVYSDADQRKHQSSASLAFVRGIHRGPVNSPHKWPVTRKMFPFDDVITGSVFSTGVWCQLFNVHDVVPASVSQKQTRYINLNIDIHLNSKHACILLTFADLGCRGNRSGPILIVLHIEKYIYREDSLASNSRNMTRSRELPSFILKRSYGWSAKTGSNTT